jgi:UDP-N-acetylmuramoylalanine--D-glutamate ligase
MDGKRIVILGAGESGIGAALLAKSKGLIPFVSDSGKILPEYKKVLMQNSIPHEEGQHDENYLLTADEVVKSPGIPDHVPIIQKLQEKNIPIISEIEFAFRYTNAKIIAITGTNGKTTTSLLTYYLLNQAGLNVCLAGNIGFSFSKEVIEDKFDYFVLEVSSFQLDHIKDFKADIAVLLNITPDHLDRYDYDFNNYIESKFRILNNMTGDDIFIYFKEDDVINNYLEENFILPRKLGMALNEIPEINARMNGRYLKFSLPARDSEEFKVNMGSINLTGPHNMVNTMASVMIAKVLNVSDRKIRSALKSFNNVPHRLEKVAEFHDVAFINDSKATNLDATIKALESYDRPIIWIAGGVDKGNDYDVLLSHAKDKVKGIICLGRDNTKIVNAFKGHIREIKETIDIRRAVRNAFSLAGPGDVILFSPSCASFDLFKNYVDRGNKFKEAVDKLIEKAKKI